MTRKIRGNVDLINEGKGGYLVDTFDINGYLDAVKKLLDNRERLQIMSNYNIEKVKQFDTETVKEKLLEIYIRN